MASTAALFTGLSGLSSNSRRLEVIGNNISNVNTSAFKSNRMLFAPTFSRNFSLGTAPGSASGGTNPGQVGLGTSIAGTQRDFRGGAISPTGVATDLAIEGDGFFIVDRAGEQFFSRSGQFQFNATNDLVTVTGERVQGFGVDDTFQIVEGQLTDISIPLGVLSLAEATRNVNMSGNLRADGDVAVNGASFTLGTMTTGGGAAGAVGTDLLTALDGTPYAVGDVITLTGAERGDKVLPDATFTVGAGSDVDDVFQWLQSALGVVPDGGFTAGEPTGGVEPGTYTIDAVTGLVSFTGNWGELNDIDLDSTSLSMVDITGAAKASSFIVNKLNAADGESVRHTFTVYDSLGTAMDVDMTMVLAHTDSTGTYWRSFVHSSSDTDGALHLETGNRGLGSYSDSVPLLHFDTNGVIDPATPAVSVELDLTSTGATDPLIFDLLFQSQGNEVTSLSDAGGESGIIATFQDGSPLGVLTSFSVGNDGIITGGFDNGLTRTIGQVALAKFTNPEGLVDGGNSLFGVGPNSGAALVTSALNFGTGRVIGGALELSNTDLSAEFINMILTQTGYNAAARVITTTDELIQQLLVIGR
jgi:flagellar hook protein FlgE